MVNAASANNPHQMVKEMVMRQRRCRRATGSSCNLRRGSIMAADRLCSLSFTALRPKSKERFWKRTALPHPRPAPKTTPMAKNYWLVKQEPEAYSWDTLKQDGSTHWTGVRNFQARNNL